MRILYMLDAKGITLLGASLLGFSITEMLGVVGIITTIIYNCIRIRNEINIKKKNNGNDKNGIQ